MANTFDVGDGIRITATFRSFLPERAVTDPSTVIFELKDPAGTITTPSVTRSSVGVYYADFVVSVRGTWWYRWEGTGALEAAKERSFSVRASQFA